LEVDKEKEHAKEIQELFLSWQSQGVLRGYGRVTIHLQKLPPKCQRDWLDLLEPPVYELMKDANRQIRSTKEHLKLDSCKGLLLIANDGNFLHTDPVNYMILVGPMLAREGVDNPDSRTLMAWCISLIESVPATKVSRSGHPELRPFMIQ